MKARDFLLVALPAVLVGAGAGYQLSGVLRGSPRAVAAAAPDATTATRAAPRSSGTASSPVEPVPDTARFAAAPQSVAPQVSEPELESALAAVTTPAVPVLGGAGAIAGTVVDESGAPVPGAAIFGYRTGGQSAVDPADVGAAPPVDESLDDYLRRQAQSWAETRGGKRRGDTGADGAFRLADLDEGASYSLRAYAEGYVVESDGSLYSVSPGQTVHFRAQRVSEIGVELVYESGGEPVEGVVGVTRGDDEKLYEWSVDEPVLRLTGGRVGVRGYAGVQPARGWRRGVDSTHGSEEVSLDVADNAGAPLRLVLRPRSGIRGRVVDEFGLGQRGRFMVRLLPLGLGAELDESALAESDQYSQLWGDRFDFLDLAAGTYALGLSNWNQALLAHQIVAVGEGLTEVDLVVPTPDPEGHLVVHAFGPSGNSLRDLDFRWHHRHAGGSGSRGLQGRRGPDGVWWLQPAAEFFEPWTSETTHTLTVEHGELGSREIELAQGQREVTVTFEEPVTIVVVVPGYAGSGYEGKLEVSLQRVTEGETPQRWRGGYGRRSRRNEGLSADGVARYEGRAPGNWVVGLLFKTGSWRTQTLQSTEVEARSGETVVTLELPVLYELAVVASGLTAGTRLVLQKRDADMNPFSSLSAELDADGQAVFEGLVAGTYVLSSNGVEPLEVVVPCGEVLLEARPPDCLRVAIGDVEGALFRAGLRPGDLIVAADGAPLENAAAGSRDLVRGEGEVSLTVLRDGERLQVTLERVPRTADWAEILGGVLTPAWQP